MGNNQLFLKIIKKALRFTQIKYFQNQLGQSMLNSNISFYNPNGFLIWYKFFEILSSIFQLNTINFIKYLWYSLNSHLNSKWWSSKLSSPFLVLSSAPLAKVSRAGIEPSCLQGPRTQRTSELRDKKINWWVCTTRFSLTS